MPDEPYHWGMAIDLDLCTGCGACVVACHAENNVPTVGEKEAVRRRTMHWLRIERYWYGAGSTLHALYQPLLCQHCQHAPCEPVCPVYASVHDKYDSINMQVYNRCIGTRLCALNCPYRVRQFNWWDYQWIPPLNEQLNPDVTVRRRGIMEKCTFCVQRIHRYRRETTSGEFPQYNTPLQPACVQTCPTSALVFGDLSDPNSDVSQLYQSGRAFFLLEELGTAPSIAYLKRGESNVG